MTAPRPPRWRSAWIAGILLALAAILAAAWQSPAWKSARERRVREALLAELRPVALENCDLSRFGGPNDSGFLMCRNLLEGLEAAYSYGVGGADVWGCDVSSRYRVPVHQYDCLDPRRPECMDGYAAFHNECLGPEPEQAGPRKIDTLANHISNNGDTGRRLVVRIDVDGAEWAPLMAMPQEVLSGIEQLAVEFHGVNDRRSLSVIRKLKEAFHLVNVYFNNNSCSSDAAPLPGWAYQVLFVNKRIGRVDPDDPAPLPSARNARDNPALPDCQLPVPDRAARERKLRETLLHELQPVALKNCTLARVGSPHDGGYLMCRNLLDGIQTAYSYGVGPNDDWGCQISSGYRVPVHQYDCFDPARPVCKNGKFIFHNECIADRRERSYSRLFDTLANQIAANGDGGKRMVVKIDIEGAEWDSITATPDEVLAGIDQLPMELHGVDDTERFLQVVRKLKRTFYLVNLHFNNVTCSDKSAPLPGWAYQVLFVNKKIGELDAAKGTPPSSPLNAPDFPTLPDCQLPVVRQ